MNIKTFVINLSESEERKSFMEAQFKFYPELNVVFHKAFDARKKTKTQLSEMYDNERANKVLNRSMVPGEIGVAKSQLDVMRDLVKNHDFGLIMEDDILISPYFSKSLEIAADFVDSLKPRIILFTPIPQYSSINPIEVIPGKDRAIFKIYNEAYYAACYLINKAACDIIVKKYDRIYNVIDNWGYLLKNSEIDIRAVVPHVVSFSKFGLNNSTINFDDKRDEQIINNINKKNIIERLTNKLGVFYNDRKHKVVYNKKNVWYNSLNIIQSKF